jgi:hypothetical protein
MNYVTLRHVHIITVAMEKRGSVALYCHLWPNGLYHIFPHYLINGTIFVKKLLNIECVFKFSLQILSKKFLLLRRIERDIITHVHVHTSCEVPVILDKF